MGIADLFSISGYPANGFGPNVFAPVEDWGAVGDGVHDDSLAINAAIAYCAPLHITLVFRGVSYAIANTVNMAKLIGMRLQGQLPSADDNAGTYLKWIGAPGGTVLFCNYDYDYLVSDIGIKPSQNIGIGIDIDAVGVSTDPTVNTHGIFQRVRVAPASGVAATLGTAVRIGHSQQGNCDRIRFYDCYFGGIAGNVATVGVDLEFVNIKILDFLDTQIGYCATGILRNQGGFTMLKPEFESNTIDIQLNNNNDPLQLVSPNTENSIQFLVVPFTTAPIIVMIDGGRLDSNAATGNYIDMASRGLLVCRGTNFSIGIYSLVPQIFPHNGGVPGTLVVLDGCVLPSDVPFNLGNYADILMRGCMYVNGAGSAVRIPDGRIVAGTNMAPSVVAGANNGGSPPAPVISAGSSDSTMSVTFGSGTAPSAGDQLDITFRVPYIAAQHPQVFVSSRNDAAAALRLSATPIITGSVVTGARISSGLAPTASQPNTTYDIAVTIL